mmetsp:Transcript_38670/g.95940  ORF Transcript_38670/g.95940 Transcript_38670/m.95940 type:complete len:482 (-) Transcript_38670:9-1454(-)|eukprot:CAMPEP_0197578462 /NCGR_PEP_ID=MMETSP1326-20131121/2662_1 /TAXON_ID=1155430 /ORGANISM="Genus nov. species nov., Strain RCC2288" /LENGTH=481 /DNA_ID=CAMNT_0043141643 /DNA_START=250 /DNA_END=1692 /DNA_ORIENTATION=-
MADGSTSRVWTAFVAGGALGTCVAAGICLYAQRSSQLQLSSERQGGGELKPSNAAATRVAAAAESQMPPSPSEVVPEDDDEIVAEQFTRNVQFFGAESQARVAGAFVIVVGLGGVGSHCAAMLLRSGVSRLRLIDFDQVSLSSLNRHAVATRADVGTPKADCLVAHFRKIYPEAQLDARVVMYESSAEEELLGGAPDFVVDCIDNIDTKVALLAACVRRGIQVLACGGAGAKCDPTRIRIADIAESTGDPLARAVRHRLKRDHNIDGGVSVLLSTEKQRCELVPIEASEGVSMKDYQVVPNFRIRTIPVLGALPAIFGMACAAHVITTLAGQPFTSEPVLRMQRLQYDTQLERLRDREDARGDNISCVGVDLEDVVYLVKDLWQAHSARAQVSTMSKGMWRTTSGLSLTRWDPLLPACLDNLVLLTSDEADEHDAEMAGGDGTPGQGLERLREREPAFTAMVDARLRRVRREFGLPGDVSW